MADEARATRLTVEALGAGAADAHATLITAEALGSGLTVEARATFTVEALMSTALATTTAQAGPLSVEVLGVDPSEARVLALTVEVIGPNTVVEQVAPGTGASVWTGQAPTLRLSRLLTPGAGALVWTGQAPVCTVRRTLEPATGQARWTGQTPAWAQRQTLEPGAGQIIWTGQTPVWGMVSTLRPGVGALVWTGQTPRCALTLPAPRPACEQRFVIPAGKLYFSAGTDAGEQYLGETPGAELAVDIRTVEVYGSDGRVAELIAEIPYGVTRELSFKCINPSDAVIAWFFGADAATVEQASGTVTDEALPAVTPGMFYQLGRAAGNPTGARGVSSLVVTNDASPTPVLFALGQDYTVDAALGRLYVVPGGAITAGTNLRVDYARAANSRTRHAATASLMTRLAGSLRLVAANTSGPNRDLYAPRVVLRADGAVPVKRSRQDGQVVEFGFKCRFQSGDLAAVYLDGRPVA